LNSKEVIWHWRGDILMVNYFFQDRGPIRKVSLKGFLPQLILATFVLILAGCGTTPPPTFEPVGEEGPQPVQPEPIALREGDILRIDFPGASNLNSRQQIRRDGKIVLSLVGEITAAGKTQAELEKELIRLYEKQLISKEVTVTVESSSFPVFVSGAVLRPGKITSDRPISALEAIMDAGVDFSRANLKAVKIIRNKDGQMENQVLDLDRIIRGKAKDTKPFYLQPSDIIFVPERFQWF
jgi:polysaccharide biosynthesis/export protein